MLSKYMKNKLSFLVLIVAMGCASNDLEKPFDCGPVTITVALELGNSTLEVSGCAINDAVIAVSATGGEEPYQFRINGASFSTDAVFEGLAPGIYTVEVKDKNGCLGVLSPSPEVTNPSSTLALTITNTEGDAECVTNNGTITVEATGGTGPYTYKLGTVDKGAETTYSGLAPGNYNVTVTDSENCTDSAPAVVAREDTGTSWLTEVKPIIDTNCATSGCHNGSNSLPDFRTLSNVQSNKLQVRSRTQSGDMPRGGGTLTTSQKALIACWVDDGAKNN
jgi:SprB repeat